jgi:hypothetical protein
LRRGSRNFGSFVPTKGLDLLVDRESGNIGRDLEQNTARLAEVDRAEIVAVLLFGQVPSLVVAI